jgi:hypothetical protein
MRRITFFAIAMTMLCSCATRKSVEYVDREVVKYQKEVVHDTLIQHTHDSVYHTIFQKGDTVFDTKYVEKTKWRDRVVVKTDTCYRDSVQVKIMESVKEKQITPRWCYVSLVFCAVFFIFAIVKVIRWVQIH